MRSVGLLGEEGFILVVLIAVDAIFRVLVVGIFGTGERAKNLPFKIVCERPQEAIFER